MWNKFVEFVSEAILWECAFCKQQRISQFESQRPGSWDTPCPKNSSHTWNKVREI